MDRPSKGDSSKSPSAGKNKDLNRKKDPSYASRSRGKSDASNVGKPNSQSHDKNKVYVPRSVTTFPCSHYNCQGKREAQKGKKHQSAGHAVRRTILSRLFTTPSLRGVQTMALSSGSAPTPNQVGAPFSQDNIQMDKGPLKAAEDGVELYTSLYVHEYSRGFTKRENLLASHGDVYDPAKTILACYGFIVDFYEQAGVTDAMDEEHITIQMSLELARDFTLWRDPDQKKKLKLWTRLSGADDLAVGDAWKQQIGKLQNKGHAVHIAPSNKTFEKRAGFDFVWFLSEKYTIYLQGMTFWPSVLQCKQLMAFENTSTDSAFNKDGAFFGYIIYGPKAESLWLIPVKHIITALDILYQDATCKPWVGPDVNAGFANETLANLFCGPKSMYSFKAVLPAVMGRAFMPLEPVAKDVTTARTGLRVSTRGSTPSTSLAEMRKELVDEIAKAKTEAEDKKKKARGAL
ncbi:hypothetical protein FB451DRAFT_1365675 [Mycena latifolia]|nr:hypothetical protein FB451DRAFT_1365675 [Mycena latifolia]